MKELVSGLAIVIAMSHGIQPAPAQAQQPDPEASSLVAACDAAMKHPDELGPEDVAGVDWDTIDPPDAILKCQGAVDAFPDHARSVFHLGRARHKAGDADAAEQLYRQAVSAGYMNALPGLVVLYGEAPALGATDGDIRALVVPAGEAGVVQAQVLLGDAYLDSTFVAEDAALALQWYRRAADQGDTYAQAMLGWMHGEGIGTGPNVAAAEEWYRRAAEGGNASAQFNLGVLYQEGRGVEQSYVTAAYWHRLAAEQGDANGQTNLGDLYYYGRGVEQNGVFAIDWNRKAADQGHEVAQFNLGMAYEEGVGVMQDYAEAAHWYRLSAEQGYDSAVAALDRLAAEGLIDAAD